MQPVSIVTFLTNQQPVADVGSGESKHSVTGRQSQRNSLNPVIIGEATGSVSQLDPSVKGVIPYRLLYYGTLYLLVWRFLLWLSIR